MRQRDHWDDPTRWNQFIPAKPKIPRDRREQLAREWLEMLSCPVTSERVAELAPVVMRYHPLSPKGATANDIVQAGGVPHRAEVEARHRQRAAARAERLNTKRTAPDRYLEERAVRHLDDTVTVARLLDFITETRSTRLAGPTWAEVADHMGWHRTSTLHILHEAARRRLISFTKQQRSLNTSRQQSD